jgi:hypothetical protein
MDAFGKPSIDVISVLSEFEHVFVQVDEDFTDYVKNQLISRYGSLTRYNELFFGLNRQTFAWAFKTNNGHNLARLLMMCDCLGIPRDELRSQITGYYSWGSHNPAVKITPELTINPFFVEGYALYVAEGDTGYSGTKRARKLRLTNAEPGVINFFMRWLESFFPGIPVYLAVILPSHGKYEHTLDKIKICRENMIFSKGDYNKKVKYRLCADNAIITDLFLAIDSNIKDFALQNEELASAYLRGLMAGEGTVYNNRSKYVRMEMKNPLEMEYARKLLALLGITFTSHERSNRKNMESVYIGGMKNIKRYYEIVGFGCQEERQGKLKSLLATYGEISRI